MTLFAAAGPDEPIFEAALTKFFGGEHDAATLMLAKGLEQRVAGLLCRSGQPENGIQRFDREKKLIPAIAHVLHRERLQLATEHQRRNCRPMHAGSLRKLMNAQETRQAAEIADDHAHEGVSTFVQMKESSYPIGFATGDGGNGGEGLAGAGGRGGKVGSLNVSGDVGFTPMYLRVRGGDGGIGDSDFGGNGGDVASLKVTIGDLNGPPGEGLLGIWGGKAGSGATLGGHGGNIKIAHVTAGTVKTVSIAGGDGGEGSWWCGRNTFGNDIFLTWRRWRCEYLGGDAGNGTTGGIGGLISGGSLTFSGPITGALNVYAGTGGDGSSGPGGAGGKLSAVPLTVSSVSGNLTYWAGDGGTGSAGGAGGKISSPTINATGTVGGALIVYSGDGGTGNSGAGGLGGDLTSLNLTIVDVTGNVNVWGGEGGAGTAGGRGGSIAAKNSSQLIVTSNGTIGGDLSVYAGNGDAGSGGTGGLGGGLKSFSINTQAVTGKVYLLSGDGGAASNAAGGVGGIISNLTYRNTGTHRGCAGHHIWSRWKCYCREWSGR